MDDQEEHEWEGVNIVEGDNDAPTMDYTEGIINIVHITGIFRQNIQWCHCAGAEDKAMQLFQVGLFPASFHRPETAYTFDVLNYFHIDAMECKTPAASFIRKVRRLTNNAFPHMVPVCLTMSIHDLY